MKKWHQKAAGRDPFRGRISGGAVEGFNNHAKLTMRRSFGFRTFTVIELALFHALGSKPVVGGASAPGGVEIGHHQLPYRLLRRDPAQKRDAA